MRISSFRAIEVDQEYSDFGDGLVPNEVALDIADTDTTLQAVNAVDPGKDQVFSINGRPFFSNCDVAFLDFAVVNRSGPEFEIFRLDRGRRWPRRAVRSLLK